MKYINFKHIFIKNFLSIGEEPVEMHYNSGMNVITGINKDEEDIKNGCGKSTLIDAFYFAIFGTTMRELPKLSYIINRKIGKNCLVKLEFEVIDGSGKSSYIIERTLAPQSLKLWKDGNNITKSSTAETNKTIIDIIGADKDIFQNCILLRANNITPFMLKKKQEKKSFIESIFNLNIFSIMNKILKDDLRNKKNEYSQIQSILDVKNKDILNLEKQYALFLSEHENKIIENKKSILELSKKITDEENKLKNNEEALRNLKNNIPQDISSVKKNKEICDINIQKLTDVKNKISVDCAIAKHELIQLKNNSSTCPTCNRPYHESYLHEIDKKCEKLESELKENEPKIGILKENIQKIEEKREKYNKIINEYDVFLQKIYILSDSIKENEKIIQFYKKALDEKQNETFEPTSATKNFSALIESNKEKVKELEGSISVIEKDLNKMNVAEHILGEYGVRAYIVNKLLELFNNRITYYLSAIKSTFKFRFNEYFEEEIMDSNGIICLYNNCSGAEMKKIDIAISFAISDMISIQKQVVYNVLFFDEILDSSLDDKSLGVILEFISELIQKNKKAVYIISHKSSIQIPNINEENMIKKSNNFKKRN